MSDNKANGTSGTPDGITSSSANAWLLKLGEKADLKSYSTVLSMESYAFSGVHEGDAVVLVEANDADENIVAIARLFRKRSDLESTTFYFDGFIELESPISPAEVGIDPPSNKARVTRLEWTSFAGLLKKAIGLDWASFPTLSGQNAHEQSYVRELLQDAIVDDILGPANGPYEEIVGMSVRDRYLVGKLAPLSLDRGDLAPFAKEEVQDGKTPEDLTLYANENHVPFDKVPSTEIEDEEEQELNASMNQSLVPSSVGFTFCVQGETEKLEMNASWGRYERTESEERINERTGKPFRCWKRIPSGGSKVFTLDKKTVAPVALDPSCPDVYIKGNVSAPLDKGERLVTLFLVNAQGLPDQNQDQAWVFQPEIVVRHPDGEAVFRRRPILDERTNEAERESLEMIYRSHVEFAVGHGISVHATTAADRDDRAIEVKTCILPQYEVPITETPGLNFSDREAMRKLVDENRLDMKRLASMERPELAESLHILTDDYRAWIDEQRARIGSEIQGYDDAANAAMDRCAIVLQRLEEGLAFLEKDDDALAAFRFANMAMASQRIHSIFALAKRRGDDASLNDFDVPKNRSWRPFQLAFVLLSIPALADPLHKDRTEPIESYADLIWFPTGGGKTEAYLGVAAFTMAIRRLKPDLGGLDASRGLAVIMRYTLRLLTIQQFQRATTLICAMETIRRDPAHNGKWGIEPFTIGLWVGQKVTPNSTAESHAAIEKEREGKYGTGSTPAQLTSCPWCGAEIAPGRDIDVKTFKKDVGKTIVYCGDKYGRCEFSRAKSKGFGLPIVVVDEEIYRRPPSMLIATVDKFAMMAWRGQVKNLFGRADKECPRHGLLWPDAECTGNHMKKGSLPATNVTNITPIRPPDLIIQDEFHLISGPLGTMVGLYETAVDELSSWRVGNKTVRPKIVASTATVRKADDQVNNVFLRQVSVFPPHGLDVEDNFFSVQRPISTNPGRRYLGICSPGSSRPAVLIRVYVALLTAAKALFERFGHAADPYMTVVGYFNSLRELGGMRRLAEDDVQTRSYRVQMSDVDRPGLAQRSVRNVDELTSRVSSKDIPKKLDQLEIKYKNQWQKGEARSIDIVLATNMLSVGVDVNRLGLMAVNGQPKNTAEYIQATSRVGRSFPGLVCSVLTWSRPRDLSHYETFEHYHATFYKHVEAQSVTPFAPRAMDRGLTGTMVSLMRLYDQGMNPNLGAHTLDDTTKPIANIAKTVVSERAWKVKNKASKNSAETMVADRVDRWVKEASRPGRRLGYEPQRRQGDVAALLKKPSALAWTEFTVSMSMREVEPGVKLIIDVDRLPDPPQWRMPKPEEEETAGGES